ncbi:hypothetical protein IMSHALPRED_005213 [Imshaugia aleurites]|uniref:ABC transporter domain-containing protein n=1 Tax=Imshaugia aleurites TaxID=172621 RepID=A0A8H3F8X6_9LECA|nr:hypothetical protein IMSHALPRED_005213 [Imshaugia aleurites]
MFDKAPAGAPLPISSNPRIELPWKSQKAAAEYSTPQFIWGRSHRAAIRCINRSSCAPASQSSLKTPTSSKTPSARTLTRSRNTRTWNYGAPSANPLSYPKTTSQSQVGKSSYIHLDDVVEEEEGANFSLGQRQLMALARAFVRISHTIVCDEATSSLNMETDVQIQKTMPTAFKKKTLLCITHRLRTIINYDRICVMDQGHVVELDTPRNLFEQGGLFREMCDQAGESPRKKLWGYVLDGFEDDEGL